MQSYAHMWNANAYSNCSPPRSPPSCPLCFTKTVPRCLKQISLSFAPLPLFLHSLKFHARFFSLITYAYCMSCCWMQVGSQGLKGVHILLSEALQLAMCLWGFFFFSFISLQMCHYYLRTLWRQGRPILLCLKSSVYLAIMKADVCVIGYAIWISIGCRASHPVHWWQAAFPVHTHNLWCAISVLMKRIKCEEFFIQTDARCNFHTRQPYGQHFPYRFLIRGWISWVKVHLVKAVAPPRSFWV